MCQDLADHLFLFINWVLLFINWALLCRNRCVVEEKGERKKLVGERRDADIREDSDREDHYSRGRE